MAKYNKVIAAVMTASILALVSTTDIWAEDVDMPAEEQMANEMMTEDGMPVDFENADPGAMMDIGTMDVLSESMPMSITSADGSCMIQSVIQDELIPAGFMRTGINYNGTDVEALQSMTGNVLLLYTTDLSGMNGNFDVYDPVTGGLSDFLQISGPDGKYIIVQKAPEGFEIPENFSKAELQWNSQILEAYSYIGEITENAGASPNDFFMVYAINSEGLPGLYIYDKIEGTYQRYSGGMNSGNTESGGIIAAVIGDGFVSSEGDVNIPLIVAIAVGILFLALIVTVIIMGVKLKEFNSYDYIDEDEEDDDDETVVRRQTPKKADSFPKMLTDTEDALPDEMPKSDNIFERYREEDEKKADDKSERKSVADVLEEEGENSAELEHVNVEEEFIIRNKKTGLVKQEPASDNSDDYDGAEEDIFSPRDRNAAQVPSRMDKKELKKQEKERKKAEKKMKKEYGEFGPVDWQAWQDAVESGEKTAAMAQRSSGEAIRPQEIPQRRIPHDEPRNVEDSERAALRMPVEESPYGKDVVSEQAEVIRRQAPLSSESSFDETRGRRMVTPSEPVYEEDVPKDMPIDMMRRIPANDNRAPVQERPVQQFDFDDDFEFEFLDLDDDD